MIEKIQPQFQPEFSVDNKLVNLAIKSGEEKSESVFAYLFNQLLGPQRFEEKMYQQVDSGESGPNQFWKDGYDQFTEGMGNPISSRAQGSVKSASEQMKYDQAPSVQTPAEQSPAGQSPAEHSPAERSKSDRTESGGIKSGQTKSGGTESGGTESGRTESGRTSYSRGTSAQTLNKRILAARASLERMKAGRVLSLKSMKGRIQKHTLSFKGHEAVKKKASGDRARGPAAFDLKKTVSDSIRRGRLLAKVMGSRGFQYSRRAEGNKKEGETSMKQSARKRLSALIGRNAPVRLKTSDRAAVHLKQEAEQETSQNGKKGGQGWREIAFVVQRYESNIPKVLLKPDYHIPKNADEIFDQIIRQFSFIVKKGGGEAHVVLEPDLLGRLKMDIRLNQREVHSVILVDNQSVKDLIISRLNVLEQSLLQHGFSLGSFQVEVNDGGARFSPESHEQAKRRDSIPVEEETSLQPVLLSVPEWISTVINVTV